MENVRDCVWLSAYRLQLVGVFTEVQCLIQSEHAHGVKKDTVTRLNLSLQLDRILVLPTSHRLNIINILCYVLIWVAVIYMVLKT